MAVSTVSLRLRRLGLARRRDLNPKPVVVRSEMPTPGKLLHLGIKRIGKIRGVGHPIHGNCRKRAGGVGWKYLHVCVDDTTRLACAEVLPDEKAATATGFLERALAWY